MHIISAIEIIEFHCDDALYCSDKKSTSSPVDLNSKCLSQSHRKQSETIQNVFSILILCDDYILSFNEKKKPKITQEVEKCV